MEYFKDLDENERNALLKYPAYISLLASSNQEGLDEKEKKVALKLSHIKTFSCEAKLVPFYKEAEKCFEAEIDRLNKELPKDRHVRTAIITKELGKLDVILKKLGGEYASALHKSMRIYKDQVSRAHQNVLEYFIFPMPIPGITD
ncbi:MAG: hypothetical protein JST58_17880 [Bacteroidetes bacterium]|nr:hypothetical protein [Bacteroidota bacterium]